MKNRTLGIGSQTSDIGHRKSVIVLDMIFIIGSLLAVAYLIGYSTPLVISPIDDYESTSSEILFSIKSADKLLIDDNMNFSDPDEFNLRKNFKLSFEPGVYYWKVVGIRESEIRTLTIKDAVVLELVENKDGYDVVNAGSVRLNIEVYNNKSKFLENISLDPSERSVADDNKYVGGLDE